MRKSGGEYEKEATAPRHGGGAPKPASVKAITGATPVKQYVEKIETEIESEEITAKKKTSSSTGARNVKGKGVGKPAEKARRRNPLPVLTEEVDVTEWNWEVVPQNHSTPKNQKTDTRGGTNETREDARKECTDEVTEDGYRVTNLIYTPAGSLIGRTIGKVGEDEEAEKQGSPKPPTGPTPAGGRGHPGNLEQQEGQHEAEEQGQQAQPTENRNQKEQTNEGGDKELNWADDPWTYMPTAKNDEEANKEKDKEKEKEPTPREVGGIRGEAGRVWADKNKGQPRRGYQKEMSKEKCYRCGRLGHTFYKCDYTRHALGYGLWWGEGDCYHCGQQHPVVRCPKLRGRCWGCGERGHAKETCPLKEELAWEERICKLCHSIEHVQDDCPLRTTTQNQLFQRSIEHARPESECEKRMEEGENPEPPTPTAVARPTPDTHHLQYSQVVSGAMSQVERTGEVDKTGGG